MRVSVRSGGQVFGLWVRFGYCLITAIILQRLFLCRFTSTRKTTSCLLGWRSRPKPRTVLEDPIPVNNAYSLTHSTVHVCFRF